MCGERDTLRPPNPHLLRQELRRESGIALVVALVVMLTVTAFGAVVVSFAQSNSNSAERSADTSVADALAEAGMNHARSVLWSAPNPLDPGAVPQGELSLLGGTATYSAKLSGTVWTLTGVSHVGSGSQQVSRTLSTQVAVQSGGAGPAVALFSADSDCGGDSLTLGNGSVQIGGAIRSNGDLVIASNDMAIGSVSSFGPPCAVDVTGKSVELQALDSYTLTGGLDQKTALVSGVKVDSTVQYWPSAFEETDFYCTYRAKTFQFNQNNTTIPEGVYCAEESFSISGNTVRGTITAIAPKISVHGNGHQLAAYEQDVLFFGTSNEPMGLSGSSYQWSGIIYHPDSEVEIRGDEYSMFNGMIEAREISTDGKAFRMIGTSPAAALGDDGFTLTNIPDSYRIG